MVRARRLVLAFLLLALSGSGSRVAAQDDRAQARELARRAEECCDRVETEEAIRLANEAIRLDPECAVAYGARANARRQFREMRDALNDLDTAARLDPRDDFYPMLRCFTFLSLGEFRSMFDEATAARQKLHDDAYKPRLVSLTGLARIHLGDVDGGLAEMDAAVAMNPADAILYRRFDGYVAKADWQEVLAEADRRAQVDKPLNPIAIYYRVRALCELGRLDAALEETQRADADFPGSTEVSRCFGLVYGTAGSKHFDVERALEEILRSQPFSHEELAVSARVLVQAGRYREAIADLEAKGGAGDFTTAFLLAQAWQGVGDTAQTRRYLMEARRLNPYLARHAEKIAGMKPALAAIERELSGEARADRIRLVDEQATARLSVAEIETLVRNFRFPRALEEYRRYAQSLASDARRREVEQRIAELSALTGIQQRFCQELNGGKLTKLAFKAGAVDVTLTSANADGYEFAFKQGTGRASWSSLGTETLLEYFGRVRPTSEETLALGMLAHDAGLAPRAFELLQKAAKGGTPLAKRLNAFLASRRGIDEPAGGFVAFKGRFVTPEEKANLQKGLVLFEGRWVPAADREKLAKGQIEVDGKWVSGEEGKLLAAGYKQYKGRWYARDDYEALRREWNNAAELSTTHYEIRTNRGDEFAASLGAVAEAAYEDIRKFYDNQEPKLPGKERMTLWAFASFDDYRSYCVEHKHEDHLQAAGFASSDANVVVGWDKTNSVSMFLQTMAHEAAHLYYFRVAGAARPPSWYAEGMATQFEGMTWNGKGWDFDRVSQSRLPFIKQAIQAGKNLPLAELVVGDALQLINSDSEKALVFYAESWALVYYLTHANEPGVQESFRKYREAIDRGGVAELKQFFPDLGKLEADFTRFVKGL